MDWKRAFSPVDATIRDAIAAIDHGGAQICLVVNGQQRLVGVVTDGNVRRGLLRGASLDDVVATIMTRDPVVLHEGQGRDEAHALMRSKSVRQVPVLNQQGQVIDLVLSDDLASTSYDNWVILMAGGLGTRLGPLTKNTPKPLLKVGPKPILETILEQFLAYGFHRFLFAVNYHADQIMDYFGDGQPWGASITYLREHDRLGTAGALSLLGERPREAFFVMNGDLLTKVNFERMLQFHLDHGGAVTVGVREYELQVPFGVVQVDGTRVQTILEKPIQRHFVSAGIYVLEPVTLDYVPGNAPLDMPELIGTILSDNLSVNGFPVHEYWADIGRRRDFDLANASYNKEFED